VERLSSSIHTIHRPLARLNRRNIPIPSKLPFKGNAENLVEDISPSDDEIENDFEASMSPPNVLNPQTSLNAGAPHNPFEAMRERSGSMATIKLHRRTQLAEKLKEIYDLEDIREVWAGTVMNLSFCRVV
jgi:sterol 3beta-glucosyltransferase